jgi:hypothetical protein
MLGGVEAGKTKTTRRRKTSKKKDDVAAETKAPKASKGKTEKHEEPVAKANKTAEESASEEK